MSFCILTQEEHDRWRRENVRPRCSDHRHCRKSDALEMLCYGDFQPFAQPIARLVGPRQIVLTRGWSWQMRRCGRWPAGGPTLRTMQLIEGG